MSKSLPRTVVIYDYRDCCENEDFHGEHDIDCFLEVPAVRAICGRCNGDGSHVNPSVDGNGISMETFAEDPEFADAYFGGVYDVPCESCHGNKIVNDIDWDNCSTEQQKAINDYYQEQANDAAVYRAEMGYY